MQLNIISKIGILETICSRYAEATKDILGGFGTIREELRAFRACIPFIGEFSVGKSSLLNHWLGVSLLPEGQGATTALATELRYAEETAMYVVGNDEETRKLDVLPKDEDEANTRLASEGLYAFCEVPSRSLKEVTPLIPVDMPGINSGIERHTKALYRYANRGVAFFLVFSPDQGTMHNALIAFLEEMNLKEKPIWLVLHKCDISTDEKIEEVASELLRCCRAIGIEPKGILRTSCLDDETPQKISEALTGIDVEELRDRSVLCSTLESILRLHNVLCTLRDSCGLDSSSFNKRIQECRRAQEDLELALRNEERALRARIETLPERVSDDILKELNIQKASLIAALDAGQETFVSRITGIINRVFVSSFQSNIKEDFRDVVEKLAVRMRESKTFEPDTEKIEILLRKSVESISIINKSVKAMNKAGVAYKVIAGTLAIVTNVLAPIVELIILFLPDIISFFCNTEERKRRKIEDLLANNLFPKICNEVFISIQNMLPELEKSMRETMLAEFAGQIKDAENALIKAQEDKIRGESEFKAQKDGLDRDISTLKQMYNDLKSAMKEI